MSVSKLTIVAQLRDELTVPLKKVIKGLDEASAAAAKGAVSADRQAAAFNRLAKEAGWSTNRMGKWVNENNRMVSRADRASMGVKALSVATREAAEATRLQEQAFKDIVQQAGYKIAADGSVRNALGLFVKKQTVATMRTMAAAEATKKATSAGKDYGNEAANQARHARLMNDAFSETINSLGYTYGAYGKLTNAQGRLISTQQISRLRADAAATATRRMGEAANQTAVHTARAGESVGFFSQNALWAGNHVERLARRFGASDEAARRMGTSLGSSINNGRIASGFAWYKRNLDSIYSHAKNTASKIESVMGKALKVGAIGVGGAAAYAAVGGMQRINALEQADVKLAVQDFNPEQREAIKSEVDQMVRGTFLTLPQALDTAQGLLGSGVEYGPEFSEYMKTMVNAQSIYSSHDPKQLELVMRQIESKEWLTGEERNQLAELGMPVNEWIAQEMGIDHSEVMDKIENREVSADVWWKAMQRGVEGGAELMGKTFTGSWLNFLAAVKRSGQKFDEPLMDPMRRGLNVMTDLLDDASPFFTRLGQAASVGMSEAVDTIPKVVSALKPLGPSLIRLVDALSTILPQMIQGFASWTEAMAPLLIGLIEFTTILLELTGPLLPGLIPLLLGALTIFRGYTILKTVTTDYKKFFGVLSKGTWAMTAAKFAVDLLAKSIMLFPGMWIVIAILAVIAALGKLYDESEWARDAMDWLSDGFRNADEWINNFGESIDNFFEKHFPKLHKLNEVLAVPLNFINEGLSGFGRTVGKETGLHEGLGTGEYAGTGEGALRFTHGSGSLDENGNPIGYEKAARDRLDAGVEPIEYLSDRGDAMEQIEQRLGMAPLPGTENSGRGTSPVDRGNAVQQLDKMMGRAASEERSEPERRDAVQHFEENIKMTPLPGPAKQSPGYADGGWTGPGTINVGERGREFITSAWAANQVENQSPGAMQFINDTGTLPPSGGITIHAPVNISGVDDPETIRAIVMAAITDAAREAEREYMNTPVRGAG